MGCPGSKYCYCCWERREKAAYAMIKTLKQTDGEARSKRLITVLSQYVKKTQLFSNINLYHVLYTHFIFYGLAHHDVTSALIKHGHDVNDQSHPGTYPLYSLLCSAKFLNATCIGDGHLECLRLLLAAGADPNFDETSAEEMVKFRESDSRKVFPSAIFGLLRCIADLLRRVSSECHAKLNETLLDCLKLLLDYGADGKKAITFHSSLDYGAISYRSVLEEYIIGCTPFLGVDRRILGLFLKNGADPMAVSNDYGEHIISRYCLAFHASFERMVWKLCVPDDGTVCRLFIRANVNAEKLMCICDYLPLDFIKICRNELQEVCLRRNVDFGLWPYDKWEEFGIVRELQNYLCTVRSLKHDCSITILRCCSYSENNVESLLLPAQLKSFIIPE